MMKINEGTDMVCGNTVYWEVAKIHICMWKDSKYINDN